MRLRSVLDIIKSTELKQLSIGEDDDAIISLLNLALIDVYSQFNILTEEQTITMEENKTRYPLNENSFSITTVYNEEGERLPLNDINNDLSVFTPTPYTLHVPVPVKGKRLSVMLTVAPPFVTASNIDTLDFIVPPQLLEPLTTYVGYRAYISMNGDQNTENSSHYNRYLRSCNDVRKRGLLHYSIMTNTKGTERGFV